MKREERLQLYREEKDPNVKDRLMLNIKVRFEDVSITKAARSLALVNFGDLGRSLFNSVF